MLARDAGVSLLVPFHESGLFHEPGGRDFSLSVKGGVAWHLEVAGCCALTQVVELLWAEHRIFEERASAAALGISPLEEHALRRADLAYCAAHVGQSGLC